jgi:hypothetical protein
LGIGFGAGFFLNEVEDDVDGKVDLKKSVNSQRVTEILRHLGHKFLVCLNYSIPLEGLKRSTNWSDSLLVEF